MTTNAAPDTMTSAAAHFAGAVRAELARRGSSVRRLAQEMGVGEVWLSRRLGASRTVEIGLTEAEHVATSLGVPLRSLLP